MVGDEPETIEPTCPVFDCHKKDDKCCYIVYSIIPASLGDDSDDSEVAPENGRYCNRFVRYEANDHLYFYDSNGTLINLSAKEIEIDNFFSYSSKNPVENRKLTAALNNYISEEEWAEMWN